MNISSLIQHKLLIYSLLVYIVFSIVVSVVGATPNLFETTIMNMLNALGGVMLVAALYDITLREHYQQETTKNFVKSLFLENGYLDKFNDEDLIEMMGNIQWKLLDPSKNEDYKRKLIYLMNSKLMPMGKGSAQDEKQNSVFDYYHENLLMKKSSDNKVIECKIMIEYKLSNNSKKVGKTKQEIFSKKYIDPSVIKRGRDPLQLKKLSITADGIQTTFNDEMIKNRIKLAIGDDENQNTISNTDTTMVQLQEKIDPHTNDGKESKQFLIEFENTLLVEKEFIIYIPYNDTTYSHLFNRPIMNYHIRVRDENAKKVTGILRSAFHKKDDDSITVKSIDDKEAEIKLNNDLLLPKEGVIIFSDRY